MNRAFSDVLFVLFGIVLAFRGVCSETNSVTGTPTNLNQLLAMLSAQLQGVDIARMNLLCAEGLPGSEDLNVEQCLDTFDHWVRHVEDETIRNYHRFLDHPEDYQNSKAYYQMSMLVMVLQEDFQAHYNPDRALPQLRGQREPNDAFFSDSRDVFIHGLLGGERRGTCSSLPVLYAAVAQRLGYPVHLAAAAEHLYLRYEEGTNHLNVDAAGEGFITLSDEEYKKWPHAITAGEMKAYGLLEPMSHERILGTFLSIRAASLTSAKRYDEAAKTWESARRYLPLTPVLAQIVARAKERAENIHKADRWDELWDEILYLSIPDHESKTQYFQEMQTKLLFYMNGSTDVAAIEGAATALKKEINDYVGAISTDMHKVQFRVALKPPEMPLAQAALSPNAVNALALVPQPRTFQIPEAQVPQEFWKGIPEALQVRLNNVNSKEQIISEMWSYLAEQINKQNLKKGGVPMPESPEPSLSLTKQPVKVEIIPLRAVE